MNEDALSDAEQKLTIARRTCGLGEALPFSPGGSTDPSGTFTYTKLISLLGPSRYSQSRLLKMKCRLTQTAAISRIANGYPAAHFSSGMVSKFMP